MLTVNTVRDLRTALLPWREKGETVGLVPTMGALHKGHLSLVKLAQQTIKRTVTSIFVNPTQFAPNEDLGKYPRAQEQDKQMLAQAGCDVVFMPGMDDMYPEGFNVKIDPGPLATIMEGAIRPGHFSGVATVVVKLLLQAMPDVAFFGEKDYQQLLVIRRVVKDLNIPVHIVGCPLVRDDDGLAMSSRNAYLSPEQRRHAAMFPRILGETVEKLKSGKLIDTVLKEARETLNGVGLKCDYIELRDSGTLAPAHDLTLPSRLLAAVRIGSVRLLDNMPVGGA